MADSHPRLAPDSIELWLQDPVTKAYLQSLQWYIEQLRDVRNSVSFAGQSNDETVNNLYRNLGAEQAAVFLSSPFVVLDNYGLVEGDK